MKLVNILILIILFTNVFNVLGQSGSEWEIKHKPKVFYALEKVQTAVNPKTGNLFTFIRERNFETLYILNSNKAIVSTFEWSSFDFDRVNLEGVIFGDESMTIVSKRNKNVFEYNINLKTGELTKSQLNFKSKKERYIETVNHDDKIFVITALKKEAIIRVYTITQGRKMLFNDYPYSDDNFLPLTVFYKKIKAENMTIESGLPVDITSSKYSVKKYQENELFSLCIEHNHTTYTFQLNLSVNSSSFYKNMVNLAENELSSFFNFNSFLFEGDLLQTISRTDGLDIFVKNLQSNAIKRKLEIRKDKDILFKNSIILQEKEGLNKRELERTNQFIRKASAVNTSLSISAFRINGNIQINLGGVKTVVQASPTGFLPEPAASVGAVGNITVTYNNPVFTMYNNYNYLKVTSIKCLFDSDYNSIDGDIDDNVFDRIKKDEEQLKHIEAKSITTTPSSVITGYYDHKNEVYKFKSYSK